MPSFEAASSDCLRSKLVLCPLGKRNVLPDRKATRFHGTPTIALFCHGSNLGNAVKGPLSGRKDAIFRLTFQRLSWFAYAACSGPTVMQEMTDSAAHSAGCSDHLQFCFFCPGILQMENFHERFFIYFTHVSVPTPRDRD